METLLIIVIAILIGLCAGSVSGLLGVGGGILTVPLMIFLLGLDFHSATTVSLFAILFVSITGSVEHHRNKHVDIKLGLIIGITGSIGAVLGSILNGYTQANILEVAFAIMLFISAIRFFTKEHESKVEGRWPLPIIGFGGGFIAGLLGLGGGIVMVQGLVYIGIPIHMAIGTSMFAMIFNATAAVLTHTLLGHLDLLVALPMTAGAVLGTWGGSWYSGKVPGKDLKRIFGVFMVVIGIYMIVRALWPT
jgi:uncharacterized membrane protein YfcA